MFIVYWTVAVLSVSGLLLCPPVFPNGHSIESGWLSVTAAAAKPACQFCIKFIVLFAPGSPFCFATFQTLSCLLFLFSVSGRSEIIYILLIAPVFALPFGGRFASHKAGCLPSSRTRNCPSIHANAKISICAYTCIYVYSIGPGECHKTCDAIAQPQMFAQFTIAVADGGGNQQLLHVAPNWPGSSVCSPKIEHNLHSARELITIGS